MAHIYIFVLSLEEGIKEPPEGLYDYLSQLGEVEDILPNTQIIASEEDLNLERIGGLIRDRFINDIGQFLLAELAMKK